MIVGTELYIIRNKVNGKRYIGCGQAQIRVSAHLNGRSSNPHLRRAVAKHGAENFETTVVDCKHAHMASAAEAWVIHLLGGEANPMLYNQQAGGGEFGKRVAFSEEHRKNLSAAGRGRPMPEKTRRIFMAARRKYSDEEFLLWIEMREAGWMWKEIAAVRTDGRTPQSLIGSLNRALRRGLLGQVENSP